MSCLVFVNVVFMPLAEVMSVWEALLSFSVSAWEAFADVDIFYGCY
jgi:hypothetical protein